jgi:hypothetical protein
MKDVLQVLMEKEEELLKLKKQVEALRTVLPILSEEEDTDETSSAAPKRTNGSWADPFVVRENAG